jgi:hypothetical protein
VTEGWGTADQGLHNCPSGPHWIFENEACHYAASEQPWTDITLPTVQTHLLHSGKGL